jgi:hypothetical protein
MVAEASHAIHMVALVLLSSELWETQKTKYFSLMCLSGEMCQGSKDTPTPVEKDKINLPAK